MNIKPYKDNISPVPFLIFLGVGLFIVLNLFVFGLSILFGIAIDTQKLKSIYLGIGIIILAACILPSGMKVLEIIAKKH